MLPKQPKLRLKPVSSQRPTEIGRRVFPVGERQGDQIFNKICIQCHAADSIVPNAPKFENKGDWAPRIAQGFDTLFQHALNGFNAMPAKGGAADLTDQELKRVITYMANKAGGTFPDPDAAAPADAAASGEAASAPAAEGAAPADAPKADAAKAEDKGAAAGGADGKKSLRSKLPSMSRRCSSRCSSCR